MLYSLCGFFPFYPFVLFGCYGLFRGQISNAVAGGSIICVIGFIEIHL